jgi:microcompartment protein CcmK/EutM
MIFAKVIGTVVASQKEENLTGKKLLLCQETDSKGQGLQTFHVAVDVVGAGENDFVLIAVGSSARMTDATRESPIDAVIMAIIDSVQIDSSAASSSKSAGKRNA